MNDYQDEDYSCWVVLHNQYEMHREPWARWVESVDLEAHGRDCFVGNDINPGGERFPEYKLLVLRSDKDECGESTPRYVLAYLSDGELLEWDQVVLHCAEDEQQNLWAGELAGKAQQWLDRQEYFRTKMEGRTQFC